MSTFLKRYYEENRLIWLSFVLAALVMFIAYVFNGYYPMGDNTIMRVDLYHQYGPFHEELRHRLLTGGSFFYSWEGGLGKEFISQFAYYTASPLSFLMLLFPQENMPEAMAVFALVKVAFSAAFCAFYLKKRYGKNDITIVIFALMYSSMAYITSYYWNIMWLDAIALFPLVALGIESLVEDGRYKMYCISLAVTIIVNFYIAFLVCIFAVLYYLVILFSTYSWRENKRIIINRTVNFVILSAIGGGISMFLTIPTAVALSHTKASDASFPAMKVYENIYQLLTNHFIGARPVVLARNEDLPNVYTGLLTIMLIPVYFLNRNIKRKEKFLFGLLMAFMLLCSSINTLDYFIHGMHFPSNLPHRYTFIYSFVLITMAYKAFVNIKTVDFKKVKYVFIIYAVVMIFTEYVIAPLNEDVERVLADYDVAINIIAGVVFAVLLQNIIKAKRMDKTKSALAGMAVLVFCECIFSTVTGLSYTGTTNRYKYIKYMPGINNTVAFLNEKDGKDFYRTEIRRFAAINEGARYHFKSYSQFSSLAYGDTSQLMNDLGMAATGNSYRFYDPTPLLDSIFNIKYIINKDNPLSKTYYEHLADIPNVRDLKLLEEIKEYAGVDDMSEIPKLDSEKIENIKKMAGVKNIGHIYGVVEKDDIYVYENKFVLPLGFMVNSDIENWNTSEGSPFDVQNDFVKRTTNVSENILNKIDITSFNYENITLNNDEDNDEDMQENGIRNVNKYKLSNPQDLGATPKVSAVIHNDKEQRVFLYVDAGNAKRVKFSVNGENSEDRELSTGRSLFDIGNVPKDADIKVNFSLDRKGEYEKTYRKSGTIQLYAASFEQDVFEKAYEELKKQPMEIEEYGDDFINGTVNVLEDGILFTSIPYDEGWSVKVDGQDDEIIPIAGNGLLGVNLTKGTHRIELSYYPVGFNLGCIISVLSVAALIAYDVAARKKRNKERRDI